MRLSQHLGVVQKRRKDRTRPGPKMRIPLFTISLVMGMVLDFTGMRIAPNLEIHSHIDPLRARVTRRGLRIMTKRYTALRQTHMVQVCRLELAKLHQDDEEVIVQILEMMLIWRPPMDMVPDRRMEASKRTWMQSNLQELFELKCRERETYSHGPDLFLHRCKTEQELTNT
mmetsp:Transcript_58916/g.123065  ORF Transcript_58916/g.123065 Transcript_58916/m.123065 type:complete len:171 (-) Transcript_58916:288-800(-)